MDAVTPRRELSIIAVALIGISRLVEGPLLWLVAALVLLTVAAGGRGVLGVDVRRNVEVASILLPAVACAGLVGALQLVPLDLRLAPALAVVWALVEGSVALEQRLVGGEPAGHGARGTRIARGNEVAWMLPVALLIAFIAFSGVAAQVPNGLVEPVAGSGAARLPLATDQLVILALADALVGLLIGFRLAAIVTRDVRDAMWSAATYAAIVGIAAAALRAMQVPRFLGPALLTLLVYLWNAYRGSSRATRRSARWIWESALLGLLALVVVAWNVALRA